MLFCGTVAEILGDATTLLLYVAVFAVDILARVQLQEEGGCCHIWLSLN